MGRWVGDRLSQTRPIPRSPDGDKKIMISGALPPRRCLVLGKVGKSLKPTRKWLKRSLLLAPQGAIVVVTV